MLSVRDGAQTPAGKEVGIDEFSIGRQINVVNGSRPATSLTSTDDFHFASLAFDLRCASRALGFEVGIGVAFEEGESRL